MLEKLLSSDKILIGIKSKVKEDVLNELVGVLGLPEEKAKVILEALKKRESIGSTGIGKGIAIPHTRSIVLNQVHLVVGVSREGVDFESLDEKPAHLFFLLCAPPNDPGTVYLVTLGKIAQIARKIAKRDDYLDIDTSEGFKEYILSLEE